MALICISLSMVRHYDDTVDYDRLDAITRQEGRFSSLFIMLKRLHQGVTETVIAISPAQISLLIAPTSFSVTRLPFPQQRFPHQRGPSKVVGIENLLIERKQD